MNKNCSEQIWQIVAWNGTQTDVEIAARLQRKLEVVSIGWDSAGDLSKLNLDDEKVKKKLIARLKKLKYKTPESCFNSLKRFKDGLKPNQLVILYKKRGKIACIGKITDGVYHYDKKNLLGNGNLGNRSQPHQKFVKWKKPINVDISDLSDKFKNIGKRGGGTIHEVHGFSKDELLKAMKKIPKRQVFIDEPAIKGYLRMFVGREIGWLERGLKLTRAEPMTHPGRADFWLKKMAKMC